MQFKNGRVAQVLDQVVALIPLIPAVAPVAPTPAVPANTATGTPAVPANPGSLGSAEVPAKIVAGTLQVDPEKPETGIIHVQEADGVKAIAVALIHCFHAEDAFKAVEQALVESGK